MKKVARPIFEVYHFKGNKTNAVICAADMYTACTELHNTLAPDDYKFKVTPLKDTVIGNPQGWEFSLN